MIPSGGCMVGVKVGSLGLDRMQWGENLSEEKVQAEHNTVDIGFKKCARPRLQILRERILGEMMVVYILLPRPSTI